VLSGADIAAARAALPELPRARRERFVRSAGVTLVEAEQLTAEPELADYFEAVVASAGDGKRAANWVLGTVLAAVNARGGSIASAPVSASRLGALIRLEAEGAVSNTAARQVFAVLLEEDGEPRALAEREGSLKVSDDAPLVAWIDEVFLEWPTEAQRFCAGETKLQGVLVGHVMRKSKGAADPRRINQLLAARLG
jgi:aspartyl-tRNA(Asn)/glutamyl-tRNA(Gln) amidotransferase subunit B